MFRKHINKEPAGLLRFAYVANKWTLACGHSVWDWSDWHKRCLKCQPVKNGK